MTAMNVGTISLTGYGYRKQKYLDHQQALAASRGTFIGKSRATYSTKQQAREGEVSAYLELIVERHEVVNDRLMPRQTMVRVSIGC